MNYEKISENVFAFIGPSNLTALIFPTKVVMIDVGRKIPEMKEIRREIEKISGKKVETVILTHFHSDHTHGLPVFSDCKIISSKLLAKRLKEAKRKLLDGVEVVYPNETFDDQLDIQDEDIQIMIKQTGGHTDDSTYVYCPKFKVLATGDNLVVNATPGASKGCDPELWIHALEEYLSLDVEHFIPGHGPVSGREKVKELLDYISKVGKVMKELIKEGKSKEEILKAAGKVEYYYTPRLPSTKSMILKRWLNAWKEK